MDTLETGGFLEMISVNKDVKTPEELIFNGCAVTMPFKVTMVKHVDVIDDNAKVVGAINTIYVRFDKSGNALNVGTNTDTMGIRDAFKYNSPEIVERSMNSSKPGLVYGGGGACRSAVYALNEYFGCDKIYVVNRFSEEIYDLKKSMESNGFCGEIIPVLDPESALGLEMPLLAVLTVPDFPAITENELLAKRTLDVFINSEEKGAVVEMCYHPNEITKLYRDFENADWKVISGVEAMIYQGLCQQSLWTGYDVDDMPLAEVSAHVYSNLRSDV